MVTETNTKLKLLSTLDNVSRWVAPNNRLNSLNLDLNENCLGKTDDFFLNQLRNFDPYVISRYPEYDNILKDLQTYTGVSKDQILLTNGADQGIELICRLFFRPGARVLVPSPVFSYYYHVLNLLGSSIIPIHYHKQKCNFIF